MAILKNVGLKTSTIDEIKDNFDGAQGVVVVNYSGLTVEQDTQLRQRQKHKYRHMYCHKCLHK